MPERGLSDLGTATAVDGKAVAVLLHDLDGAPLGTSLLGEQGSQTHGMRAADGDPGAQPGSGEVCGLLVGDEPALVQGEDPVRGAGCFLRIGGGREDRPALGRVRAQQAVQPPAFALGKPFGRVVEHQGVRVGEEGAGEAEPTVHATGERAEAFVAQADEADRFEHFVGPSARDTGGRAQHAQMAPDGAGRMPRHVAQEDTHLA
ncbi:hypothetical protein RKD18_006003 [Streptomyces phaeoluteigriseus]